MCSQLMAIQSLDSQNQHTLLQCNVIRQYLYYNYCSAGLTEDKTMWNNFVYKIETKVSHYMY